MGSVRVDGAVEAVTSDPGFDWMVLEFASNVNSGSLVRGREWVISQ